MRFWRFVHDQYLKTLKKSSRAVVTNIDSESEDKISAPTSTTSKISKSPTSIFTPKMKRQGFITNYITRPLSEKDKLHFENLALPIQSMSNWRSNFAKTFKKINGRNFTNASADKIGVTAAFDGWTNIKRKHLFDVVFITSQDEALVWNVHDVNFAGKYAAARRQLQIEYSNKVFIPCMAHQINLVFSDIFKESDAYKTTSKNAIHI
ncbi:2330_t:CDS:2, partial [Ambispora gerdemannii]